MKYVLWLCAFILGYGSVGAIEHNDISLKQGVLQVVIACVIAFLGYVLHVKEERNDKR